MGVVLCIARAGPCIDVDDLSHGLYWADVATIPLGLSAAAYAKFAGKPHFMKNNLRETKAGLPLCTWFDGGACHRFDWVLLF